MSSQIFPIYVPYWITGLASAIGARAYSAAGVALASRETGVATEEGATAQYIVRATIDDVWVRPLQVKIDDGSGNTIHVETIDDVAVASGGGGVILGPVIAQLPAGIDLRARTKLTAAQFSAPRLELLVFDAAGEPIEDLADRTLRFVIHDENSTGIAQVTDDDIERDTGENAHQLYVNVPTAGTALADGLLWTLWDISNPSRPMDLGRGPFIVEASCLEMA